VKNSPWLPVAALVLAIVLTILVIATTGPTGPIPLSELQLGAVGGALALTIYAVQGLISVGLEGEELRPGLTPPHLTDPLSAAIVVAALLLFLDAVLLGYGIVNGWDTARVGVAAGIGCLLLAAILLFYKEASLGDEAHFDDREDGIPW
jgi:hypothetical protein